MSCRFEVELAVGILAILSLEGEAKKQLGLGAGDGAGRGEESLHSRVHS